MPQKAASGSFALHLKVKGNKITEYPHEDGNIYVCGKDGTEYTISVFNPLPVRALAVVTVDGLSVMDGKPGSYESNGYILAPRSGLDIPGFRRDENETAKFVFSRPESSYAAEMGKPTNIGVIGVAFFPEKQVRFELHNCQHDCNSPYDMEIDDPPPNSPWDKVAPKRRGHELLGGMDQLRGGPPAIAEASAAPTKTTRRTKDDGNLGTGWGDPQEFLTRNERFVRENPTEPMAELRLFYKTAAGLKALGIDIRKKPAVVAIEDLPKPDPFPLRRTDGCPPPPSHYKHK